MSALTGQDIAAARAQGDLSALLLMASGMPVTAATPKQRATASAPMVPRTRPGAWPDGCGRPALSPEAAAYVHQLWPGRYPQPDGGSR